jgi:uncharacterized membrane protein
MVDDKEDERLAHTISWTLFSGLTASVFLFIVGWLLILREGTSENRHVQQARGWPARVLHGDGAAILELGLLVLMLTPVARVLILAVGWFRSRDRTFSLIAFFVLALLTLSVLLGTG